MKTKKPKKHYRSHGTGGLIQQASGLFLAKWSYGGKTYVRSTQTHDKEQALKKLNEFVKPFLERDQIDVLENLQAKVRGIQVRQQNEERKQYSGTTFKDLFDTYVEVNKMPMSESTENCYRSYIRRFQAWLTENHKQVETIGDVTREMTVEYLKHVETTRSNATYNVYLVTFRKIFSTLRQDPSLWDFKQKPACAVHERRALTTEEVKKLMNYVADDSEMSLLFNLGVYTGLRLSDCCMIRWKHIDLEHKLVSLVPIKTSRFGKTIHIPLHPKLFRILKKRSAVKHQADDYVSALNAHKYKHRYMTLHTKKIFQAVGINDGHNELGFHTLRHTFVSVCANSGVPLPIVQAIFGHSCEAMTKRYYHLNEDSAAQALARISW